jgi:hypothetical protein
MLCPVIWEIASARRHRAMPLISSARQATPPASAETPNEHQFASSLDRRFEASRLTAGSLPSISHSSPNGRKFRQSQKASN